MEAVERIPSDDAARMQKQASHPIAAADWEFYAEKVRKAEYALDDASIAAFGQSLGRKDVYSKFAQRGENSYSLWRRSDLRAHLVRELLAGIINDANICKLVLRVREDLAIERDVVQRVRVGRLNGA